MDGIFVVREKLVLKGRISATGEWDGNLQWERIAEHPLHPLPSTADEAQMTKKKKKKKRLRVNIHLKHTFSQGFLFSLDGGDIQWLLATAFGASIDG